MLCSQEQSDRELVLLRVEGAYLCPIRSLPNLVDSGLYLQRCRLSWDRRE